MTTKTKISLRSIITQTGLGIALAAATLAGTANATEEIASRQMSHRPRIGAAPFRTL